MVAHQSRLLTALDIVAALLVSAAAAAVFFLTPVEASMGLVQKVFYFHVAANWAGMLGFIVAAVCAGGYLRAGSSAWDIAESAAVEIGLVFTAIGIVSGSIWAYSAWGTFWTWDPRLTTAAIMVLLYAAYFLLRQGIENPERRARFAAVYAIIGIISVPATFLSIRMFRTIHPVLVAGEETLGLTPAMQATFFFSLAAFSFLFASLFWHRIRLGRLAEAVEIQQSQV